MGSAIAGIVDFWARWLELPWDNQPPNQRKSGDMAAFLATWDRADRVISAEQVALFRTALTAQIENELTRRSNLPIGTDYGPDHILQAALEAAKIKGSLSTFPWKTMSWVHPLYASVGVGYKKAPQLLAIEEGALLAKLLIRPEADAIARSDVSVEPGVMLSYCTIFDEWFVVLPGEPLLARIAADPVLMGYEIVTLAQAQEGLQLQLDSGRSYPNEVSERVSRHYYATKIPASREKAAGIEQEARALFEQKQTEDGRRAYHRAGREYEMMANYRAWASESHLVDFSEAIGCYLRAELPIIARNLLDMMAPEHRSRVAAYLEQQKIPNLLPPEAFAAEKEESC